MQALVCFNPLAAIGMYLLSALQGFTIALGDFQVFIGAFFWAGHVQLIGWLARRIDSLQLACVQFTNCSLWSADRRSHGRDGTSNVLLQPFQFYTAASCQ